MQEKNLRALYDNLCRIDVRHGDPFKGIKKFTLVFQDGEVEIKSNTPPERKANYPQILQTKEELAVLKSELLALATENWQEQYLGAPKLDDDQWRVVFIFQDGERWTFVGVNAYPPTWQLVCELAYKYSGLQITEKDE